MNPPPKIDERTSREIVRDVRSLLPIYVDKWGEGKTGELADVLIHVFGRFGELIIDRLNRTPEKNLLAFLDLVGIAPLPLEAACAPVTFFLAPGTPTHATVPAGTRVAAPPAKGAQEPVVFETERELVVVPVKLESLVLKEGAKDQLVDFNGLLAPTALPVAEESDESAVSGKPIPIPHIFYVRLPDYPVWPVPNQVMLKIGLDADLPESKDARLLRWELLMEEKPVAPSPGELQPNKKLKVFLLGPQDGTGNLTISGDLVFRNVPASPPIMLEGLSGRWLRCLLSTPISSSPEPREGMVREKQLPTINSLSVETTFERTGIPVEAAFFNSLQLDVSKDFYPFGEKPRFGDTLYLSNREAFSNPDAEINLQVAVTNPVSAETEGPLAPAKPQNVKLLWEFWDGMAWSQLSAPEVSTSRIRIERTGAPESQPSDRTQALSDSGDIRFRFPKPPVELQLHGQSNFWIRVRIVSGDYGREARFEHPTGNFIERELTKREYVLIPATFAPPSIRSVKIDYAVRKEWNPGDVITNNDFAYEKIDPHGAPFRPFTPVKADEIAPSLYLGFTLPPSLSASTAVFPHYPMSVYMGVAPNAPEIFQDPDSCAPVTWDYWNGAEWVRFVVLDETNGLRRSGIIRFLVPPGLVLSDRFDQRRYWLRLRGGELQCEPKLHKVALNTTTALQGSTIANEILGASNGTQGQQFRTTYAPVLAGQTLEVREPIKPSQQELARIRASEEENAVVRVSEPGGNTDTFWVRWSEVPNFYGSGPRDRHYLLDRETGEITFGDSLNGMIPPVLPGNIRSTYRSGGGAAGNQPGGAIAQLQSAIPYIQKVSNCEAASGGTEPETDSQIIDRGLRGIRHGGRAVTLEDFEDLAHLASREVARTKCVPLFDLTRDPDNRSKRPGVISVIVVPRSTARKPKPDLDLLDRVQSYLDKYRQLTANLVLVAPEYLCINVDCEIAVTELEKVSELESSARQAIESYLHPITGGPRGAGWGFGRKPNRLEFFGLLEKLPGVDHVRSLQMSVTPDRPGMEESRRFLICSGNHHVSATMEE